ncbi:MAG TPA: adenine phosphoribosyltransferase [Gemmatimonadales bacterium]|nr:adenine phosphoribosyltransferase [Gemmatimonadales bacterium]
MSGPGRAPAPDLRALVRTIPDYPKPGILFRDITTLLGDAAGFREVVVALAGRFSGAGATKVAGIEARGFILGGALAHQLGVGFVPVRKQGKLPYRVIGHDYDLEYGTDRIEIHVDAVETGERVLLVDDLIATGGTAVAASRLLRQAKAEVVGAAFIIELPELGGRKRLEAMGLPVHALISFDGH